MQWESNYKELKVVMLTDCLTRNKSRIHICPNKKLPYSFKENTCSSNI